MDLDSLITRLTDLRKELGNVAVYAASDGDPWAIDGVYPVLFKDDPENIPHDYCEIEISPLKNQYNEEG